MCKFFSAIGMKNGDILYKDGLDSHSDLIDHFDLPDDRECRHFVKLEFLPRTGCEHEITKYTLSIDEDTAPIWTNDVLQSFEMKCRDAVSRMILTGHSRRVFGETVIISPGAYIRDIRNARVLFMNGGRVLRMENCHAGVITNGSIGIIKRCIVIKISGGETHVIDESHVSHLDGGTINLVSDSSLICVASGGNIGLFRGTIGKLSLNDCKIQKSSSKATIRETRSD
jgi:hypothetical protein